MFFANESDNESNQTLSPNHKSEKWRILSQVQIPGSNSWQESGKIIQNAESWHDQTSLFLKPGSWLNSCYVNARIRTWASIFHGFSKILAKIFEFSIKTALTFKELVWFWILEFQYPWYEPWTWPYKNLDMGFLYGRLRFISWISDSQYQIMSKIILILQYRETFRKNLGKTMENTCPFDYAKVCVWSNRILHKNWNLERVKYLIFKC